LYVKTDVRVLTSFALIFLFGTCFTFPNLGGAGLYLPFNNAVWLAVVLFICVTVLNVCRNEIWLKPDNALIHLFLVLAMILPLLWNLDTTNQGLMRMTGVVLGIIFFICLFSSFTVEKERALITIIVASGLIQAIWGTIQIFLLEMSLPTGIFQQPNVMASFLVTTFIGSLMLLDKAYYFGKNPRKIIFPGILFFAFLVGIVIATLNSRTAYLGLIVALPLMCLSNRLASKNIWPPVLFLLLGALVGSINSGFSNFEELQAHASSGFDTSFGRLLVWKISLEILKENWLFGIGYGNFEQYFLESNAQYYLVNNEFFPISTSHPHNELLLWGIEGGILPTLALLLYTAYTLWRIVKKGKTVLPYAAMLIPLVTHALIEYPFYHSILHFFLFLTLLFLFELHAGTVTELKFKQKPYYKGLVLVFFLTASAFFITNLHASYIIKNYYETDVKLRKLSALANIINPASVNTHIDYAVLNTLLTGVKKSHDSELMRQFVEHSNHMLSNHPRPEIYVALLEGYSTIKDKLNYDKTREIAHYYYPRDHHFDAHVEQ
jgi:O-antigen ligase